MKTRLARTLGRILNRLEGKDALPNDAERTERAFRKVQLTPAQRGDLFTLRQSPGFTALLDMMEMACVEQESNLINVPATEPDTVLAEHRLSKAFWQVFIHFQKKVQIECDIHLGIKAEADRRVQQDAHAETDEYLTEL